MMLEQRKGVLLQPVTRICWHILLVFLWYPQVRGLLQLRLGIQLQPQINPEHSRVREENIKILVLYSAAILLLCA